MDYAFWGLIAAVLLLVLLPRILAAKHRVSSEEARRRVGEGALLLDVRTPAEFAAGHIDGARNIPVGALQSQLGELVKDRAVVVYCHSGMRSASAARMLAREGFEVYDLGPMRAW